MKLVDLEDGCTHVLEVSPEEVAEAVREYAQKALRSHMLRPKGSAIVHAVPVMASLLGPENLLGYEVKLRKVN